MKVRFRGTGESDLAREGEEERERERGGGGQGVREREREREGGVDKDTPVMIVEVRLQQHVPLVQGLLEIKDTHRRRTLRYVYV